MLRWSIRFPRISQGHAHLEPIGHRIADGLRKKGFNVWVCHVGGLVDDGIAMGHFGMKYSLPSRELITDEIETVLGAHPPDAWVGIGNCDKIVPGMLNAMARCNVPAVYVSGGPMLAGKDNSDLVTVFEGVGAHSAGKISEEKLRHMAETSCRTCGSCSGMFTANSMNCLAEVIGLALPGNGGIPAAAWTNEETMEWKINPERLKLFDRVPDAVERVIAENIRPRDIITHDAIDDAFTLDVAYGRAAPTPCCTRWRWPPRRAYPTRSIASTTSPTARRTFVRCRPVGPISTWKTSTAWAAFPPFCAPL